MSFRQPLGSRTPEPLGVRHDLHRSLAGWCPSLEFRVMVLRGLEQVHERMFPKRKVGKAWGMAASERCRRDLVIISLYKFVEF